VGPDAADILSHRYEAQVEQLRDGEQPPQELPLPAMAWVIPELSVEQQAKVESTRSDSFLHSGQSAFSLDRLIGRIFSNFTSQEGQTYS